MVSRFLGVVIIGLSLLIASAAAPPMALAGACAA